MFIYALIIVLSLFLVEAQTSRMIFFTPFSIFLILSYKQYFIIF